MLTRPVKCALRLDEALHEHRSLLHCLLPVLHTLPQLFQYTVVVSLERMNRFEEEVDICIIRPQAYGVKHARCLDYAPAIVLLSERPVVIACSIRLLQVYYWRVRPGLSKPGKIIITCRACMQGTWMPKIEAKNQWYTALKCKIGNLLRLLDTVAPLSRYSHILKQEQFQPSSSLTMSNHCSGSGQRFTAKHVLMPRCRRAIYSRPFSSAAHHLIAFKFPLVKCDQHTVQDPFTEVAAWIDANGSSNSA